MYNHAVKMVNTVMERYPILADKKEYHGKWAYDIGVVLKGIESLYKITKDNKYFEYIQTNMDYFIQEDGSINRYNKGDYNIDYINNGKLLFFLYEKTKENRYLKALELLRSQLETHPRTTDNVFWHKQIYANQIWLDGLYMGAPFYLEFTQKFEEGQNIEDVVHQYLRTFKHTYDTKTHLLHHAYDEKKQEFWCDTQTGLSKNYWARSIGWYVMGLIDVIEMLPQEDSRRIKLEEIFIQVMQGVCEYQDESGTWYQIINMPHEKCNYLESSASSMFAYGLAKGRRLNVLDDTFKEACDKAYHGLYNEFILETKEGWYNLNKVCSVAGLGGKDLRDGSYAYYMSEPIVTNDLKGVGAYIQANVEYEGVLNEYI